MSAEVAARGEEAMLLDEVEICLGSCLKLLASAGHRAWPVKHKANVETELPPDVHGVTNKLGLGVPIPDSEGISSEERSTRSNARCTSMTACSSNF